MVEGLVFGRDLEDDLVGASIGDTSLRSNVYSTENDEWKEIVIKTINGAVMVAEDLPMENGVVHVIDRVLSRPTEGNILETLRNEPHGRFTTFLKALKATKLDREIGDFSSELTETKINRFKTRPFIVFFF